MYNEIYYNIEQGKYIILYYYWFSLLKVKRQYRVVSLFKDKDVQVYMHDNNINKRYINIMIIDVSKISNKQINKLIEYIEQTENAIIKKKKAKTYDDDVVELYQDLKKYNTYHIKSFKACKKEHRRKIIKEVLG